MIKKALFLCFMLTMLHQAVSAHEVLLTIESDKSAYPWDGYANFKATAENQSPDTTFAQYEAITYRLTVRRYGVEVWEWSEEKGCGG